MWSSVLASIRQLSTVLRASSTISLNNVSQTIKPPNEKVKLTRMFHAWSSGRIVQIIWIQTRLTVLKQYNLASLASGELFRANGPLVDVVFGMTLSRIEPSLLKLSFYQLKVLLHSVTEFVNNSVCVCLLISWLFAFFSAIAHYLLSLGTVIDFSCNCNYNIEYQAKQNKSIKKTVPWRLQVYRWVRGITWCCVFRHQMYSASLPELPRDLFDRALS